MSTPLREATPVSEPISSVSCDESKLKGDTVGQRKAPLKARRKVETMPSVAMMPYGLSISLAELNPGGRPSTTVEVGSGLTEVRTAPLASVRINVAIVGTGFTPGRVVTFNFSTVPLTICSMSGEYVDVARSLRATTEVGTEELNMYEGVVKVGVGTTKLGRVVGTVSVREEKRAESEAGDRGTADADRRG